MSKPLITLMNSLSDIMEEESDLLAAGKWPPDNDALATSKTRITGSLEVLLAEKRRTDPNWLLAVPAESPLAAAIARLRETSVQNATLLSEQTNLSPELLKEIAHEAGRLRDI